MHQWRLLFNSQPRQINCFLQNSKIFLLLHLQRFTSNSIIANLHKSFYLRWQEIAGIMMYFIFIREQYVYAFFLSPPTTPCYCDVTMHALYFLSRETCKAFRQECPTCDEKRRQWKREMDHQPLDEKWTRKSVFSNLAGMYTKRDQFVIPLTCTFCGNLVTNANFSPAKYSGDLNSELVRYSNGPKQFAR